MLLKVSDGVGGWVLFDKVDEVYLLPRKHSIVNPAELTDIEGEQAINLVAKECFQGNGAVPVGVLEFVRQDNRRTVLFTKTAFICNDDGDTLDRYNADQKIQQKR